MNIEEVQDIGFYLAIFISGYNLGSFTMYKNWKDG